MNHSKREAKGSWLWNEGRAEKGRTWKKLSRHQCHRVAYKVRTASLLRDSQLLSATVITLLQNRKSEPDN